jgi:Fe2+ or Zn2+ uptake regulation protein
VVETIVSSPHALNPLEVFELARKRYPKLGLVTVYRTVEKLEELDLIQRLHQPAGCHAFVPNSSGHQHILVCQACGRVEFFSGENDQIDLLMTEVGQASGYRVKDHWLQLFGVCGNCQQIPSVT